MKPEQIRNIRKKIGATQNQLAALVGVHPITATRWESGAYIPTPWQEKLLERIGQTKIGAKKIKVYLQECSPMEVLAKIF